MNDSLIDSFVGTPPRESGGAIASNRFDFQKDWALCKLLSLHSEQDDYLLILDYHEDIVLFDSSKDPQKADFFQIKSKKSGNWTISSLTKPKNSDALSSIFGKLFNNHILFKDNARSIFFVSNQGTNCVLKNSKDSTVYKEICFSDIDTSGKKKLSDNVKFTASNYSDLEGLNKFCIRKTELSVNEHTTHTKGRLVDFFDTHYPDKHISAPLAYKTIFDEIRMKTNVEMICTSLSELSTHKGISHNDFSNMVNLLVDQFNAKELWQNVSAQLMSEGYVFAEIKRIERNWKEYIINRMDSNNELLNGLKDDINILLVELFHEKDFSLKEIVEKVNVGLKNSPNSQHHDNNYINAAIIYEANRYETVQEISAQSEEETV